MASDTTAIFCLYRSFHRQIRLLPTQYLRQFFRLKLSDDVRVILHTKSSDMRAKKASRVRKELSKMRHAMLGHPSSFDHILDVAYGRKGPLRHEYMKPLLSDPEVPLPPPIIPSVEKSRPPVYSPELVALLTTSTGRKNKGINHALLKNPPKMPARGDPSSEQARLLGPLSKRREVNIRWRFFTEQWKKVYPPAYVVLEEKSPAGDTSRSSDPESLRRAGVRGLGMQGTGIPEETASASGEGEDSTRAAPPEIRSSLPNRFVRRRYQHLLGRLPTLTYRHAALAKSDPPADPDAARPNGRYQVSMSPLAINSALRWSPTRFPPVPDTHLAWVQSAETIEEAQREAAKQVKAGRRLMRLLAE
ncbi:hypothetical protein B0H21DRAFT_821208 [Amylocystis lapponica]|nr:hypothetical protein B0H21DRAFT_821208 [Amylocystis lapponica]